MSHKQPLRNGAADGFAPVSPIDYLSAGVSVPELTLVTWSTYVEINFGHTFRGIIKLADRPVLLVRGLARLFVGRTWKAQGQLPDAACRLHISIIYSIYVSGVGVSCCRSAGLDHSITFSFVVLGWFILIDVQEVSIWILHLGILLHM